MSHDDRGKHEAPLLPPLPEGNLRPQKMLEYCTQRVEALYGEGSIQAGAVVEQLNKDATSYQSDAFINWYKWTIEVDSYPQLSEKS
jgi:hypothetical protein